MESQKLSSPFDPENQLKTLETNFIVHVGEQAFVFEGPYRFHRDNDWIVVHKARQAVHNPANPSAASVISWKEVALFFLPDCVICQ